MERTHAYANKFGTYASAMCLPALRLFIEVVGSVRTNNSANDTLQ